MAGMCVLPQERNGGTDLRMPMFVTQIRDGPSYIALRILSCGIRMPTTILILNMRPLVLLDLAQLEQPDTRTEVITMTLATSRKLENRK